MQWLKDFVNSFFQLLYEALKWLLEGVVYFLKYIVFTIYDGLLIVIHAFLSAIDLSSIAFNMAAQYGNLPSQLIWMINQVNLPQALALIGGAIMIRMTLNIIPAAVTRV